MTAAEAAEEIATGEGWWVIAIQLVLVVLVVSGVYSELGSFRKRPLWVTILTLLGWSNAFFVVFMIPNDLVSTNYVECIQKRGKSSCSEPLALVSWDMLVVLWRVQYILGLTLTYLVLPFLMNLSETAEFHMLERIRHALKKQSLVYGTGILVALVCLGIYAYVEGGVTLTTIESLVTALSNVWGLFLLICLLGFGLEQIPRQWWRTGNRDVKMLNYQYRAVALNEGFTDARQKLNNVLSRLKQVDHLTGQQDPYRRYVDKIIEYSRREYESELISTSNEPWEPSYKHLVDLHADVRHRIWKKRRAQALLDRLYRKALDLEDVLHARAKALSLPVPLSSSSGSARAAQRSIALQRLKSQANRFQDDGRSDDDELLLNQVSPDFSSSSGKEIHWRFRERRKHRCRWLVNTAEYYWKIYAEGKVYKAMAILGWCMTVAVVWSEATLWSTKIHHWPSLSPFAHLVRAADVSLIGGQLLVFLILAHIATCAFFFLFLLRLFDYYRILPHHQTDAKSLMFSAAWLCRLILPLAYNFFTVIDAKQGTAFAAVLDHMGTAAEIFSIYFPISVLFLTLLSFFNVHGYLLQRCGVKRFQFRRDFHDDQVDSGRMLLRSESQRRLRTISDNLYDHSPHSDDEDTHHNSSSLGRDEFEDSPVVTHQHRRSASLEIRSIFGGETAANHDIENLNLSSEEDGDDPFQSRDSLSDRSDNNRTPDVPAAASSSYSSEKERHKTPPPAVRGYHSRNAFKSNSTPMTPQQPMPADGEQAPNSVSKRVVSFFTGLLPASPSRRERSDSLDDFALNFDDDDHHLELLSNRERRDSFRADDWDDDDDDQPIVLETSSFEI